MSDERGLLQAPDNVSTALSDRVEARRPTLL